MNEESLCQCGCGRKTAIIKYPSRGLVGTYRRFVPSHNHPINKKRIRNISFNGETKQLGEWANTLGIHHASLIERLDAGWPLEEALTLPKGARARTKNQPIQCVRCGEAFPWNSEHFTKDKSKPLGCTQPCKACSKIDSKKWYKDHIEKERARERERYKNNREHEIARAKAWKKANPRPLDLTKKRLESHLRRVREKSQRGVLTKADILLLYKNQKGKCWWCQKPLKGKYEIDHRVPISRGGLHDRKNIVISCVSCNRSKHNKLPQEWAWRLL
jgi:5-methylcytosine-specific restriction endonuclease McrA